MTTHSASLPGGTPPGQDRWAATGDGLIVLDGATPFSSDTPSAERYVDALLDALRTGLGSPTDLRAVISAAIATVATSLGLEPGEAPSSTVALLRWTDDHIDVAVLGDSTIIIGTRDGRENRLTDDRLQAVGAAHRQAYRKRLERGTGYDHTHRRILADLQATERRTRNTHRGYWIAEASSHAGHHATTTRYPARDVRWAVLATDGAQRLIDHLHIPWNDVAANNSDQLRDLLRHLHQWEAEKDPDGRALPRAKPHDDKTLLTWTADQH
ncbi:protein phosphatase 2C domain-containing protein [Pseudonocardia hispaniensis]|uniref:Protein phosphatase 2C domain-containing protein n=1 Tax=Pseudonocardia hispaniensis TaxID=904933 RepID=A0ABW1J160_9PSEU